MDDALVSASLAYRKNEAAIHLGKIPDKYARLLPHVPGQRILEIGSAEGVLSLLLARQGKQVTALEKRVERHVSAQLLYSNWHKLFDFPTRPALVCGEIGNRLDLLNNVDTLVAVRMIYYLGDRLDEIFAAVANKVVPNVVLCGNKNRAARWRDGKPDEPLGEMNKYAALEGMRELLLRHGYRIAHEVIDGDEIVVGKR